MYGNNDFGDVALFEYALLSSKSACTLCVSLTSLTYVTIVAHDTRYHTGNVFSRDLHSTKEQCGRSQKCIPAVLEPQLSR